MPIPPFVHTDLAALDITLNDDALDKLARYLDLLLDANTRMNLTAIRDADTAWRRMIVDSLTLLAGLENLDAQASLIDIGTGGGLPGIPVAIARPDLNVTLLESTGKKVDFLNHCIAELGLQNTTAIQQRAEILAHDPAHRQRYDIATNRAVGPMALVLEYSLPFVKTDGRLLAMKGPKAEEELKHAGDALALLGAGDLQVFEAYPESFNNDLVIISVIKDNPTPKTYPREPGIPKKTPL